MNPVIPHIEDCYFISRKDNIIIANLIDGQKIPLVRLKQKFIDVMILEREAYDYMIRYLEMFPDLWEPIEKERKTQLLLFSHEF